MKVAATYLRHGVPRDVTPGHVGSPKRINHSLKWSSCLATGQSAFPVASRAGTTLRAAADIRARSCLPA